MFKKLRAAYSPSKGISYPLVTSPTDYRFSFNLLARQSGLRLNWIPKNMCSTLKLSFAVAEGIIDSNLVERFTTNPQWVHNWIWPLEPRGAFELAPGHLKSFVIIRSPTSRLRSALIEKALYQEKAEFDRIVLPIMRSFSHYNRKDIAEFTYIDLLDGLNWYSDRILDPHFVSQSTFLHGSYDVMLRFEDTKGIGDLLSMHGITMYRVDSHSASKMSDAHMTVGAEDRILTLREQLGEKPEVKIKFSSVIEDRIDWIIRNRYSADAELWSSLG